MQGLGSAFLDDSRQQRGGREGVHASFRECMLLEMRVFEIGFAEPFCSTSAEAQLDRRNQNTSKTGIRFLKS